MTQHQPLLPDQFEERMRRLRHAAGGDSDVELAKALGITAQSVSSARRRRQIPGGWIVDLAETLGISADWLLYGAGSMHREPGPAQARLETPSPAGASGLREQEGAAAYGVGPVYQPGDLVLLPKVLPRLVSGSALLEPQRGVPAVAFQHFFLSRLGRIATMVLMDMHGDHMAPAIGRGDLLLVDRSQTAVIAGNIYVLAFGEEAVVKRVDRMPGKLRLLADNPAVPPIDVDHPGPDVLVLGRVVWSGRSFA